MNKQELIGNLTQVRGHINIDEKDQYTKGRDTAYEIAIELTKQLNEPELPVIPQFVADYISSVDIYSFEERIEMLVKSHSGDSYYFHEMLPTDGLVSYELGAQLYEYAQNEKLANLFRLINGYTIEPPKTRQVLVKFFDNEEYKTELTEESARELIEFLEANKNE